MNTLKKSKGYVYIDAADVMLGIVMILFIMAVLGILLIVIVEESKPLKYGVVSQTSIECVPAVEAVEATDTTDAVAEQGPYTCTITAQMDDQYMRDLYLEGDYLQTLEWGQHRIGDPYPENPEAEDEGEVIAVDGELTENGVSITITTESATESEE